VRVEVIVNGLPIETKIINVNEDLQDLAFDVSIKRSSWVAIRIFPSSHTNPVWVIVNNQPVRASKKSVEWLLKGVEKCWDSKRRFYDKDEMEDAIAAYNHARQTYKQVLAETNAP
jgi:hypothetical protein